MGWPRLWVDRRALAMAALVAAETAALVAGLSFIDASVRAVQWNLRSRGLHRCTVYGWPRAPRYDVAKIRSKLRDVVRAVERSASLAGSVELGGRTAGRWIVGVDTEAFADPRSFLEEHSQRLVAGRYLRVEDGTALARVTVLTENTCTDLGVSPEAAVGRTVKLVPARGHAPVPFEVVGVVRDRPDPDLLRTETPARAFVPLSTLIRRLGYSREGYPIVVFYARSGQDIEAAGRRVAEAIREVYGPEDYEVKVWTPARFKERIVADHKSFDVLSYWLTALSLFVLLTSTALGTAAIRRAYAPDLRVRRAVGAPRGRLRRELTQVLGVSALFGSLAGAGLGLALVAKVAQRHTGADPLMDPHAFLAPRLLPALVSAALAVGATTLVAWLGSRAGGRSQRARTGLPRARERAQAGERRRRT